MDWPYLTSYVLALPPHHGIVALKHRRMHPLQVGFRKTVGLPSGQIADYRLTLMDGRSIHALEYWSFYLIHWDVRDPSFDPIGHLQYDVGQETVVVNPTPF
jgi:hypothetical protein